MFLRSLVVGGAFLWGGFAPSMVLAEEAVGMEDPASTRGGFGSRTGKGLSLMRLAYRVRMGSPQAQRQAGRLFRLQKEIHAIPYLLGLLRMKEAEMRRGAALALGQIGLRWTGDALLPLLRDPVAAVRLAALEAIALLQPPAALPELLALLPAVPAPEAKAILHALTAFSSLSPEASKAAITSLQGLPTERQKALGLGWSLTLASLGDTERRERWKAFFARNPERAGPLLAQAPGLWTRSFLLERLAATPTLRPSIERWLLTALTDERIALLSDACSNQLVSTPFCKTLDTLKVSTPPPFPPLPRPFYLMTQVEQARTLHAIHRRFSTWPERLDAVTEAMLGIDYRFDALGEGPTSPLDRDPIFSLRELDCVTFLEEALAMSFFSSMPKAIEETQKLRYIQGRIAYSHRRHLPLYQWIPGMIQRNLARDITSVIGQKQTLFLDKTITLQSYKASKEGALLLQRVGEDRLPQGKFLIPYLSLSTAILRHRSIPPHTVISILRPAPPSSPFQTTHQGLVVSIQGQLFFRHSTRVWKSVVDTPLLWYLQSLTRYRRPFLGIHLLQLSAPPQKTQ